MKDIYKLIKKDPNDVKDYIDSFQSNRYKRAAFKEIGARKVYEEFFSAEIFSKKIKHIIG